MPRRKHPLAVEIGKKLRQARDRLEMSQAQVAQALGVTPEAYGSYERGWIVIPTEVLVRVPFVLHMPVQHFLGLPDPADLAQEERQLVEAYRSIQHEPVRRALRRIALTQADLDAALDYEVGCRCSGR